MTIDEIIEAHKAGTLKEIFGAGTAAVISFDSTSNNSSFVHGYSVAVNNF